MYYVYFETEPRLLHEGTKYNVEVPTRELQDAINLRNMERFSMYKNSMLQSMNFQC